METVYERALAEAGNNGRFQRSFDVVYNVFMVCTWVMAYMNVVLVLVVIPHTCQLPPRPHNVSDHRWKQEHLPLSKDAKGDLSFSSCLKYLQPGESNETTKCSSYDYDKTWYESTASSDNNWVCDDELYVADTFAYSRIGEIVGSVALGWFGDTFGRRPTYIISVTLIILGRIITLASGTSFWLFLSGCVITAIPSWMVAQCVTVISMEISSAERRTTINTLRSVGWTMGMCALPFVYWLARDWRLFMIVSTAGLVPYLLFCWRLIESPRWLWLEGRAKESVRVLKRIAKYNGNRLETNTERQFMNSSPPRDSKGLGPLALFSSWILATNTILQLILWISLTVNYTVLIMSSGESTGNPFLEFAWQSAAELPGTFLAAWLADCAGRRHAGALSFALAAVLWVIYSVRATSSQPWLQSWWFGLTLTMLLRLSITVVYYVISLFNMELYPTCLRQSGMSLGNMASSASSALGPYILYLGRNVDARLPGAILTGISILGALSSLLLPETLNRTLPESLEDARSFGGGDRRYFSLRLQRPASSVGKESIVYYKNDIKCSI